MHVRDDALAERDRRDLGLARTVAGRQKLRTPIGTRQYMPPEQCEPGWVTTASDILALGATIHEGVSGERPFPEGDDAAERPAARYPQLELDPVPLGDVAHVSGELETLTMRCLERDPDRRPRSAAQGAAAFERILEQMKLDDLLVWPRGTAVQPSAGHRARWSVAPIADRRGRLSVQLRAGAARRGRARSAIAMS
ncbi:MAG: hypothetical protein FJ028_03185 [Chloroflexi bacterium]|nr:hypothetical protein [Chloroflexota bacterium]